MTQDVRDLIEEARQAVLTMDYDRAYQGGLVDRLVDALEASFGERDAALAAIERVREEHQPCYTCAEPHCFRCKEAKWPCVTFQALDGAPEPEVNELPETGNELRDEDGDLISSGEHRKVLHQGGYVCDTCTNSLGLNVRWDHAIKRRGHAPVLPSGGVDEIWRGRIVTASFENGTGDLDCGLEECECPEHDQPPIPAGTYVTVGLDKDERVGLADVEIRVLAGKEKNDE